ncbi:hypothetical protein PNEG_03327 [Pneumocystis murina B123]|uniref:U3 small nucleolar ribonucleoprotein protein MPP10 n=1 Tax=Pneumocystis murina (strain B123) TaxID=1069680 RepID=M7NMP5_PNEMU|nr:hypothetical protein PNEG_03327 [Pneumocystis murina B123]EMR08502.1 hypothetical protein PNEG_03327 [Pneumocystis murina B123]
MIEHEMYTQLDVLLHDPKQFLKPSNKLHSTILFQVKKLLDPIIKQNSIFDDLYLNGLDGNQIFEEVRLITNELIDRLLEKLKIILKNQVNLKKKLKYKTKREIDTAKEDVDSPKGLNKEKCQENSIDIIAYKSNILPINDEYISKEDKNIFKEKVLGLNNLPISTNNFNNKIKKLEKIDNLLDEKNNDVYYLSNLSESEVSSEYSDKGFENTNEIKYANFFLPSIKKKSDELSNIQKTPKNQKHNDGNFEKDANIKENHENIMSKVQQDLFANSNEEIKEHKISNKSKYMKTQKILSEEIKKLEMENIAKKDWTLMGEVKAKDRFINSLLEEDIEFERETRPEPVITKQDILNLEEIIKKRIIDSNFNDIQKIYSKKKKTFHPSKLFEIDDEKNKKSLAEIYEDEYNKKTDPNYIGKKDEKLIKEHNEIEELFKKAMNKLNSLSSLYHKPKLAKPTLNIISNVSTIIMEEAQPSSLATNDMLAPHEIYITGSKKVKGEILKRSGIIIAKNEMTREEKNKTRKYLKSRKKHKLLNQTNKLAGEIIKTLKKSNVKIIQANNEKKNIIKHPKSSKEIKRSFELKL